MLSIYNTHKNPWPPLAGGWCYCNDYNRPACIMCNIVTMHAHSECKHSVRFRHAVNYYMPAAIMTYVVTALSTCTYARNIIHRLTRPYMNVHVDYSQQTKQHVYIGYDACTSMSM